MRRSRFDQPSADPAAARKRTRFDSRDPMSGASVRRGGGGGLCVLVGVVVIRLFEGHQSHKVSLPKPPSHWLISERAPISSSTARSAEVNVRVSENATGSVSTRWCRCGADFTSGRKQKCPPFRASHFPLFEKLFVKRPFLRLHV